MHYNPSVLLITYTTLKNLRKRKDADNVWARNKTKFIDRINWPRIRRVVEAQTLEEKRNGDEKKNTYERDAKHWQTDDWPSEIKCQTKSGNRKVSGHYVGDHSSLGEWKWQITPIGVWTPVAVPLNKALRDSSLKREGGAALTEAMLREIRGRQTKWRDERFNCFGKNIVG